MKNIVMAAMASASLLVSPLAMATESYVASDAPHPFVFEGYFDVFKGINIEQCKVVFKILSPDDSTDGKHAQNLPWNPPIPAAYYHTDINNIGPEDISLEFSEGDPPLCAAGVVYLDFIKARYVSTDAPVGKNGVLTLHGLHLDTPLTPGGCKGDLPMHWDEIAQTLTPLPGSFLPDASAPGVGPNCYFTGSLDAQQVTDFSAPDDNNH